MEMAGTEPLLPDLDRLRAQVRADQRATSAPMFAFGALILGYAAVGGPSAGQLHAGGRHLLLLLYWPLATLVGLVALRRSARRRAGQDGVGEGRRGYRAATRYYLIALLLVVVLFVPVLFVGVFTPLVWPAAVLAALASWQHNRLLGAWAAVIGVVGGTESVVVIAGRGLTPAWWWLQPVVYLAVGTALIAAGVAIRRRELADT